MDAVASSCKLEMGNRISNNFISKRKTLMLAEPNPISELIPNQEFTKLASDEQIESVVKALKANNIHVIVVENGEQAKAEVLKLVPQGAEVYANISKTLETIGISAAIDQSGRYDAVRRKVFAMDRKTQADEI